MSIIARIIITFASLGALIVAGAQAQSTLDIEAALERAQRLFESGSLPEAIADLEIVCKEAPDNSEARKLLGSAYRFQGIEFYLHSKCDEAVTVWGKALEIDPGNKEIIGFIHRCESEMQSIAILQGDSTDIPSPPPVADAIDIKDVILAKPDVIMKIVHDTVTIETMIPCPPRKTIGGGLAFGPVFKTGGEFPDQSTGWGLLGHVSLIPEENWPGFRIEGLYARMQRDISTGAGLASVERAGIWGGSASIIVDTYSSKSSMLLFHAGAGAYEVFRAGQAGENETIFSDTSIKAGLPVGGTWRYTIGKNYALTFDAQYVYIGGSSCPDILFFALGLSTF